MSDSRKGKSTSGNPTTNNTVGAKDYLPTKTDEGSTSAQASSSRVGDLRTATNPDLLDGFVGQPARASSEASEKLPMEEELPDDHVNNFENSISQMAAPDSAPKEEEEANKNRAMDQQSSSGAPAAPAPPNVGHSSSPDNDHGNRFQSKLLFLFFMRAINNGYEFHLGTELEKFGGKFDDLIFLKYYPSQSKRSFLYVQAKHRQDESKAKNKITAANLLNDNKGDFSLIKYFHSYRDNVMKAEGGPEKEDDTNQNQKVDCVVCTNIDFNVKDLAQNGIKLVKLTSPNELNDLSRKFLTFEPVERQTATDGDNKGKKNKTDKEDSKKIPACYRLKPIPMLEMHFVANALHTYAKSESELLDGENNEIKCYQAALFNEKVLVSETNKNGQKKKLTMHPNFINGTDLLDGAKELRNIIDKLYKSWRIWSFHSRKTILFKKQENFNEITTKLWECANNPKKQSLVEQFKEIQRFALVNEKVIISRKTFSPNFINNENLSVSAEKFRNIIIELEKIHALVPDESWKNWIFFTSTDETKEATSPDGTNSGTDDNIDANLNKLAKHLKEIANNPTKLLNQKDQEIKNYDGLMEEILLDSSETMIMHPDFISSNNLSSEATELKETIDKRVPDGSWTKWTFSYESIDSFKKKQNAKVVDDKSLKDAISETAKSDIEDFFNNKLLFAVNTPNEEELDSILKVEVGENKEINLSDTELQSAYILSEMNKWFKSEKNVWLSAEEGKQILLEKMKGKMDSLRATSLSLDYQEELMNVLSFNEAVVKEMAEKLKQWLVSRLNSADLEIMNIVTPLPKLTAVKVFAALKHQVISGSNITPNYKQYDSYFVTSSERLNKNSIQQREWIKKVLTKEGNPHGLLIVVRDDDSKSEEELVQSLKEKKVIIIGKDENASSTSPLMDTISYGQLSDQSKFNLCSKTVSFQKNPSAGEATGEDPTVGQLIVSSDQLGKVIDELNFEELADSINKGKKEGEQKITSKEELQNLWIATKNIEWLKNIDEDLRLKIFKEIVEKTSIEKILDEHSIEELIYKEKQREKIEILSYSASPFEQSLYIHRKVRFDFDFNDSFWEKVAESVNRYKTKDEPKASAEELQKQCKIDSKTGRIEWEGDIGKDLKSKIWWKISEKTRNPSTSVSSSDVDDLILEGTWRRRAVIIAGVAGTGKSTVLSHFYEEIKKKNRDHWVIRIDLKHHFKVLENYKLVEGTTILSDVIDFIASLPTVVNSRSPFANSLLRHRLETNDRIVLMFDGYDELNSECQKKTAQIMKILAKKSIRLYVTTRPHMVDELQSELDQLAYTLQHFERDDKIKCMTSFWINKLNAEAKPSGRNNENHMGSQLEKDPSITLGQKVEETKQNSSNGMQALSVEQKERLEEMAKSIVEGLSADLKDKEESFIGIPLQCRILAECFLQEAKEWSGGTDDAIQLKDIVDAVKKLDVASLYRKLMDKKRQIFLEEKGIIETGHPIVGDSLNLSMNQIGSSLTELAIHTIVSNTNDAEILWPSLIRPFQSPADRRNQVNKLNELCIRFGLVDRVYNASSNDEKLSQLQFLHRTYAEYLVAEYLYKGFKLVDDQHNELLDNEFVRKLIADEIFAKDEYNGVRIFLDSMLKEIVVDMNDEWISKQQSGHSLPVRLKQITVDVPETGYIKAIENRNSNLFVFLFDCLQATSNEDKIKEIVESAFNKNFRFNLYYEQSSQVFERLIKKYYDVTSQEKVKFILGKMLREARREYCVEWKYNQTERDKILKHLFDLMARAKENGTLNAFLDPEQNYADYEDSDLLRILTCKDGYENRLKQFLDIYVSVYHQNDNVLADLLKKLFERYENGPSVNDQRVKKRCTLSLLNGKIQKILVILKDHKREEVLKRISRFFLKRDPLSFKEFYNPKEPEKEEDALVSENMESIMNRRDSAGMTRLHRAVYHGHTETVNQILKWIVDNKTDPKAKDCLSRNDDTGSSNNKDALLAFTPFYVAYALGHREIGTKILECLKEVFSKEELKTHMTDVCGFLHQPLLETFIFDETELMEWILTEINRIFGSDLLDGVLKSKNCKEDYIRFDRPREKFMEVTANLLTDQHSKKEFYKKVSDLVFIDANYVKKVLQCTAIKDNLEKMIEADGGIGNWIKRFFTINGGFKCLNDVIKSGIIKLNEDLRNQLKEAGMSKVKELGSNVAEENHRRAKDVPYLLECIQRHVSKEAFREVLLHNDGEFITRISLLSIGHECMEIIRTIIELLQSSDHEYREQVAQCIIRHAITMIRDIGLQRQQRNRFYDFDKNCIYMSQLFVDYASNEQLLEFVDVILLKPNDRDPSIWSRYLKDKGLSNWEGNKFLNCVSRKLGVEAGQRLRKQDVA